jgi:G:T-mismatch repair DNA endonuclease (very short patch repair protein)
MISNKQLMTHIRKEHNIKWEDYVVKYFFDGKHPTCGCGCGEKVKLLRSGKNDKGELTYARTHLTGHNTRQRSPGYRSNTQDQKDKMRASAIQRMKDRKGTFFESGPSKVELELQNFVTSLGITAVFNDKELLSGLEIDILLPKEKIAIEFNGSYFHCDLFKTRGYHLNKTKQLNSKGYNVVHVWECDWKARKDIIKSTLTSLVGKTPVKIYARNTVVKEISNIQASEFLRENHLQGTSVSKVRLGLFHKEELVSVMTFSGLRKATGRSSEEGSYELVRFCSKKYTNVVGGASKLLKAFKIKYNPSVILSFANRDWSTGNVYEKLGFTFNGYTPPGYFYVKSNLRYSRFQFQKHKLIQNGKDPNLTEYEIMTQDGYLRLWDCGNLKYVIRTT